MLLAILIAAAAPAPSATAPTWYVDWGEQRCTLGRKLRGAGPDEFAIRLSPGSDAVQLVYLTPGRDTAAGLQPAEVTLDGGPETIAANGRDVLLQPGEQRAFMIYDLDPAFVDRFATAKRVSVTRNGGVELDAAFAEAGKAVEALYSCRDDVWKSWGLDPAAIRALQRRPKAAGNPASWMDAFDYPDSAIRAGASGSVTARLTIAADGSPRNCKILVSSGHRALDQRTCQVLQKRGRFQPALNGKGEPVPAPWLTTLSYHLYQER